jgi:ribonucleoside-triphosphate reductase
LAQSGTGERGIFNLEAAQSKAPSRRYAPLIQGTNPCGEIMLRDMEFCNLSEVVVRPEDDLDSLLDKVETATWLGVVQSSFTDFPYLRKQWKKNCDTECLLGVSLTGQMDNPSV